MNKDTMLTVRTDWLTMFLEMPDVSKQSYLTNTNFRACFTADGNFVFDTICSLQLISTTSDMVKINIAINNGNVSRDKDCNEVIILDSTDYEIMRVSYTRDEWLVDYGTINKIVPLFL